MLWWAIDNFFPLAVRGLGGSRNGGGGGGGGRARTKDAAVGEDRPNPWGEHATWVAFARDVPSTGEGGMGVDNNDRRGAAINAPSATKDTEVGQGKEGGQKGGMEKEEPRTADSVAMPAVVAAAVVALEEENERRVGELLTAYGSIATKMTTARHSRQ
jgi:hypothetical protein